MEMDGFPIYEYPIYSRPSLTQFCWIVSNNKPARSHLNQPANTQKNNENPKFNAQFDTLHFLITFIPPTSFLT